MPARVGVLEPFFRSLTSRIDPALRPVLANLRVTGPIVARLFGVRPETDAMIRTTTAVTMVYGGVKPNVLPQEASAVVNFRILPGDSIESVVEHVRRVVGDDIVVEAFGEMSSEPSRFSSTASPAWQVLHRSISETFPDAVVAPWILTGATDSRYYTAFAGDIYGFAPFTGAMDMLSSIHGTGERIRVADAEGAVSFFCRIIRNAQAPS
jgi:carboxypeptidase PM20D1